MSTESITLDPRGDVTLQVTLPGHRTVDITACSRVLRRLLPAFERILYMDATEANVNEVKNTKWVISLTGDNLSALVTLLNMAHCYLDRVPKTLSMDELYDLTVVAHRYDASQLLGPWARTWMTAINDIIRDTGVLQPKALWISWELGQKEAFMMTAYRMLVELEAPELADNAAMYELLTPPCFIEHLKTARITAIDKLLAPIRKNINSLLASDEDHRWCRHATWMGPRLCESMILGSLMFSLSRIGLWPLPDPGDVQVSVADLSAKISRLRVDDIGKVEGEPPVDHQDCNPQTWILEMTRNEMRELPNLTSGLHLDHLAKQFMRLNL
ncbi:hypothetical protein BGZ61DRAFT_374829 [Ilyonectria robusta]|uniref:uncharacterized protein n=1 Tax=Ilyonectria robusta TaxID=1079257 RepID=UPI001E8CD9AE|nr:uncharacterized protein BGZ61DRAFT_374829 [Ilyonectria robusta]KAH8652016.1 hypothetical protein BGZ61DRAFT_374829 [Ilyonectria robusta]